MRRLPLLAAPLISLNAQAAPASSESVQELALTHAAHLMDSIWRRAVVSSSGSCSAGLTPAFAVR